MSFIRGKAIWRKTNQAPAGFSTFCGHERLLDDDIGKTGIGADGRRVEQRATVNPVRIVAKDFASAVAGGQADPGSAAGRPRLQRSPAIRNVFVTVQSVGDEKRNDNHVWRFGQFPPIGHERRFFHVNVEHGGIFAERADLSASRFAATALFSFKSVPCAAISKSFRQELHRARFACAFKEQIGHQRDDFRPARNNSRSDRLAFGGGATQLKLARNHRLREIAFTDKIGHHRDVADRFRIEQKHCVAQARFFLPERALDIGKNVSPPNLSGMRKSRRAGIRVHGGAVATMNSRVSASVHISILPQTNDHRETRAACTLNDAAEMPRSLVSNFSVTSAFSVVR